MGALWRVAHFQSLFFGGGGDISLGFCNKQGLLINQNLTFLSKFPVMQCPLPSPPLGPLRRKLLLSSTFLYISLRAPSKAAPPLQVSLTQLPQRETLQFQSPLLPFLKISGKWTSTPGPQQSPYREREISLQSLLLHITRSPGGGEQGLLIKFTFLSKSPVKEPLVMLPQQGPYGERCSISRANGLFIPSFISLWVPQLWSSSMKLGGNIQPTIHGVPRGWKSYV